VPRAFPSWGLPRCFDRFDHDVQMPIAIARLSGSTGFKNKSAYGAERKLTFGRGCFRLCPKADRQRSAQNRQDWGGMQTSPVRRNDDAASGLTERLTGTDD
jgi:hypothetical protein